MEISERMFEDMLSVAREVRSGGITLAEARASLVREHGFNPNTAAMNVRSLCHLLRGERYRRALTIDATDHFLRRIREQDGSDGLRMALQGLSLHVEYRRSTGVEVPGLQRLLEKYIEYVGE